MTERASGAHAGSHIGGATLDGKSDDSPPATRREVWCFAAGSLVVTALYVVNSALHGALGASRNDDWAYLRVVFRFVETGEFSLDGWTKMAFVGQALLAWPVGEMFGSNIAAMQLLVAILAWAGVVACFVMLRSFTGRAVAALAVGSLMVGPLFGSLATSFMTDVPLFCFQMLTLLAATRLITRGWSDWWFIAMCGAGALATSIREYGVIVLAVCSAAVWLYCRPVGRKRMVSVAGIVGSALAIGIMLVWRSGVPDGDPNGVPLIWVLERGHVMQGLRVSASALLTLAFFVAPAAGLAFSRSLARRVVASRGRALAIGIVWIGLGVLSRLRWLGNYVGPGGSYVPLVEGSTPPVLSPMIDSLARGIAYVSLLGILLLAGLAPRSAVADEGRKLPATNWFRALDRRQAARVMVLSTVAVLACAHLILLVTSNTPFFDRYLIVFIPITAAALMQGSATESSDPSTSRRVIVGGMLAGLAVFGMAFVDASATLDGAKWRYGERLAASGFAPNSIDAGFEWFNFHQEGTALQQPGPDRNWWTSFYASVPVCVSVVARDEGAVGADVVGPPLVARSMFGVRYRLVAVTGPSAC